MKEWCPLQGAKIKERPLAERPLVSAEGDAVDLRDPSPRLMPLNKSSQYYAVQKALPLQYEPCAETSPSTAVISDRGFRPHCRLCHWSDLRTVGLLSTRLVSMIIKSYFPNLGSVDDGAFTLAAHPGLKQASDQLHAHACMICCRWKSKLSASPEIQTGNCWKAIHT